MKRLFVFLLIVLAFTLGSAWAGDYMVGGTLGFDLANIKTPGATVMIGSQNHVTENNVTRVSLNKVNYGKSEFFDNIGGQYIRTFPINEGKTWLFGLRASIDIETDDSNFGKSAGIEIQKKNLFAALGFDFSVLGSFDIISRPELDEYFAVGAAMTLAVIE